VQLCGKKQEKAGKENGGKELRGRGKERNGMAGKIRKELAEGKEKSPPPPPPQKKKF